MWPVCGCCKLAYERLLLMPRQIPGLVSGKRTHRSVAFMDQLESRTLFAASPSVVHVGPTQPIKPLDAVKWPGKGPPASRKAIGDAPSKPYATAHHGFWGNVPSEPADPSHPPTLQLE